MERASYGYGMKMTGFLLHSFFTIVLTVSVVLLGTMIDKDMLGSTDIGTNDFFASGYYVKCMEQKCEDLNEYLRLMQQGEYRSLEQDRRYLQYTNEFSREESNFCFWYKSDGIWYTNQPDTRPGQIFDTQAILMEARTMGNYLLYDMENKEFGTDIRGLEDYFFGTYNHQIYWPLENVVLVFGVDVELSAHDDLYEARMEYERLYPWTKIGMFGGLISLVGWILTLVYLTLSAGHKAEEEGISLNLLDRIKTELLFAGFIVLESELFLLPGRTGSRSWDVPGFLAVAGTVSFLADLLFLIFYLSMVRRLKAEVMWESSLICWLCRGLEKLFRERSVTVRIVALFAVHMLILFALARQTFVRESMAAFVLLLVFCGAEAYFLLRMAVERYHILEGVEEIANGDLTEKIELEELHGDNRQLAEAINNIGTGLLHAVDENTKNERMKADLITNVSHDIKTPLTSIINYVDLIKREEIADELTEDLVEASKISSGNVKLDMQKIDLVELVCQTGGEFNEKFEKRELTIITRLPQEALFIWSDGRHLYRVIENLYNNAAKYALEKTRVYVEVQERDGWAVFSIKNVSERSLALENGSVEDLTERFIRGDSSRTTEGSGLGLSIAKNLAQLMGGTLEITVDGDLFTASLQLPIFYRGGVK